MRGKGPTGEKLERDWAGVLEKKKPVANEKDYLRVGHAGWCEKAGEKSGL